MAAFVFKVFTLAIRTAAKPLANRFQAYVLSHPTLRPRIVSIAQVAHGVEVTITRGAEGKVGRAFVGNLSDEKALDLAGRLVSEGFILVVGIGVIAWEYNRQNNKDLEKRAVEKAYRDSVDRRFLRAQEELTEEMQRNRAHLSALASRMDALEERLNGGRAAHSPPLSSWGLLGTARS